jgi:hypothetical protein
LLNPWTLGAVPHEVAHNIQADLGLWDAAPAAIGARLREAGIDEPAAATWARWHKEVFADLCGVLLIGPAAVTSLTSVVSKSPARTLAYDARAVHPPPYLRVLINLELLRRLAFDAQATELGRTWERLYPARFANAYPAALTRSFARANALVVDTLCFQPFPQLGGRSLADVVRFGAQHAAMVEEAAGRLAAGVDPGIVPERFLIAAARVALDRRLARPGVISQNFYDALERR